MPLPILGWIAAAAGAALVGKLVHDAATEGSSSSRSSSGDSEDLERERRNAARRNAEARQRAVRKQAAEALTPELAALLAHHGIDPAEAHFHDEDAEAFADRILAAFEQREEVRTLKEKIAALEKRIEEADQLLALVGETR